MRARPDIKRLLRRLSQGAFLLLFFVLLVKTDYDGKNELAYPVKIFLDADLLVFLTSLVSAHSLPPALFLALRAFLRFAAPFLCKSACFAFPYRHIQASFLFY